jgi:hypothetical protein
MGLINNLLDDPWLLDRELRSFGWITVLATIQTAWTFITKSSPALVGQPLIPFIAHGIIIASAMAIIFWLIETEWGIRLLLVGVYLLLIQATNLLPTWFVKSDPQLVHYLLPALTLGFARYCATALYLLVYFITGLWYSILEGLSHSED